MRMSIPFWDLLIQHLIVIQTDHCGKKCFLAVFPTLNFLSLSLTELPQTFNYPLSLYPVYFLHASSIGQLLKELWYFRQRLALPMDCMRWTKTLDKSLKRYTEKWNSISAYPIMHNVSYVTQFLTIALRDGNDGISRVCSESKVSYLELN